MVGARWVVLSCLLVLVACGDDSGNAVGGDSGGAAEPDAGGEPDNSSADGPSDDADASGEGDGNPSNAGDGDVADGDPPFLMLQEQEPNDGDNAQPIDGPGEVSASSGGDDFEDSFVFTAPAAGDYDIILEDFEQAGYDVNVFTEDGSVDEVGSIYADEDELILTVTLEEGQELFIVIYVLVDLEQSYTLAIVPAGEEDPGTDIAGDGDGDGDATGGEGDRFGFGTTGDGPTDYVEGEGDVVFVDAYFSDEPEPGQLIIGYQLEDGSGLTLALDGRTPGTYGGSDGLFTRVTSSGSVYQDFGASGPQEVILTAVGGVGEKVEGSYRITVTLVGCDSCSNTSYAGSFSATRSR